MAYRNNILAGPANRAERNVMKTLDIANQRQVYLYEITYMVAAFFMAG